MSQNLEKEFLDISQFSEDIRSLTTEYTKLYPQDKKNIWSILLNYLQNESANGKGSSPTSAIGHDGFLQSDILSDSAWAIVDSNADLDNDETDGTLSWFSTLYSELKDFLNNYWNSSYYSTSPNDTVRENALWNDSLEYFLKYFYQYIDPEGIAEYEKSGYLVQNDDGTINTDYLKASIPVSGGANMRVTDVKNADAGFFFVRESEVYEDVELTLSEAEYDSDGNLLKEAITTTLRVVVRPWVIPWYNINGHSYSYVRSSDKNIGVLSNDEHLQFTRERWGGAYSNNIEDIPTKLDNDIKPNTKSENPYIRLIMPEYKRRVEIEDLDRNFWVIAQVITAISAYLFDDDSPIRKMFKELLNEILQLWENVLYLWAAVAGLGAEPYYTDVHTEVIYLPNSEEQSYLKYDNFVRQDSDEFFEYSASNSYRIKNMTQDNLESILQERMRYLIQSYTENNLCVIPALRVNNYEHNYYSCEVYPCVMLYNRNEKNASVNGGEQNYEYDIYWFTEPIIIDLTDSTYWTKIYGVHEEESEYYFKTMFDPNTPVYTSEEWRFYGAVRTVPNVNCSFDSTNGGFYGYNNAAKKRFSFTLELTDLAGVLSEENTSKKTITVYPKSNFGSLFNEENKNSSNWNITYNLWNDKENTSYFPSEPIDIERGYYLGETPSYYSISEEIEYSFDTHYLVGKRFDTGTSQWKATDESTYYYNLYYDDYNSQEDFLSFLKTMDGITLQLITNELDNTFNGVINFQFYTMQHQTNLWSDGSSLTDGSAEAYILFNKDNPYYAYVSQYNLYNNNTEYNKNDMYSPFRDREDGEAAEGTYNRASAHIIVGALIYNPITTELIQYSDYEYMTAIPGTSFIGVNTSGNRVGYNSNSLFIYANGDVMKKDNWYLRYVQCDGGEGVVSEYKDQGCYDGDVTIDLDSSEYDEQKNTHIISHIKVHIFTYKGEYYSAEKWRCCWPNHNAESIEWTDWVKTSGYDSVRNKLNTYTLLQNQERDFEKYDYNGIDSGSEV